MERQELYEAAVAEYVQATGVVAAVKAQRAALSGSHHGEPVTLEVNILELAAGSPILAQLFYDSAEVFRQMVRAVLVAEGKLHPSERLWLRPTGLLAESFCCVEALELLRCHPGCTVAVHGVCCAATAIFPQRHSRTFVCGLCGAEAVAVEGEGTPSCCGVITERPEKAVNMQGQLIYLAQEPSAAGGTQLGEPTIAVHLVDDLCGKRVGDRLLVVGVGRHVPILDVNSALFGCKLVIQMEAVGVEVLPPLGLTPPCSSLGCRVQLPPPSLSQGGLEGLLGVLGCCFDTPCSPLLRLALLLSAAATGVQSVELGDEDADDDEAESYVRRSLARSRVQVNLLMCTRGPEPHLERLLQQAASGLCQLSAVGAADPKRLLPRLFTKHIDPSLQLQLPLAIGGQLAEASDGVLILHTACLGAKPGAQLAAALRAGSVPLVPNMPERAVRISPTIWCLAHDQDLGKARAGPCSGQPGETCAQLAAKYGGQGFLSQFDILLDCAGDDVEDADLWAEQLLGLAQRQQQAVQSASSSSGGEDCRALAQVERGALAALQAHLQQAVTLRHPCMTAEAMDTLGSYFRMIRAEDTPQGVLESMARVATACARLCHRHEVLAFPDAMVAVLFMEEQLVLRGGFANLWAKWRAELDRGTELGTCLEGLYATLQDCHAIADMGAEE